MSYQISKSTQWRNYFFDNLFFWKSVWPISSFSGEAVERSVILPTPYKNYYRYDKSDTFRRRPRQSWKWQIRNKYQRRSYFPDKNPSESQINCIIWVFKLDKNTDNQSRFNAKKADLTADLVAAVAAAI